MGGGIVALGKFKAFSSLGMLGISASAVPTTLIAVQEKGSSGFDGVLSKVEGLEGWFSEKFGGIDGKLENEYKNFGGQVGTSIPNSGNSTLGVLKNGETWISTTKSQAVSSGIKGSDVNYYTFEAGNVLKALIRQFPTMIRDSFVDMKEGARRELNLLSFQKIGMIAKDKNISSFLGGIMTFVSQNKEVLSQITVEDAHGILQIFRELKDGDVSDFLKKVGTNASKVSQDQCASRKIMDLLIGKKEIEDIQTNANTLKTTVENMADDLKGVDGIDETTIESLKQALAGITSQSNIGNPCPSGS